MRYSGLVNAKLANVKLAFIKKPPKEAVFL